MGSICTAWIVVVARPWWFGMAVLLIVPPLAARYARRRGRNVPSLSVVVQCVVLLITAAALAGVSLPLGEKAFKPYLLLHDVSGSVRGQSQTELPWPEGLEHKTYRFGLGVGPVGSDVGQGATQGGAAMRSAAAEASELGGIVIHTDGRFTDEWELAAANLGLSGAKVMIVPMEAPKTDARVVEVFARRGRGRTVDITVSIAANAPRKRKVTVRRMGSDKPLLAEDRLLIGATTIRLADALATDQAGEYRVELGPGDVFEENDRASTLVMPQTRQVALYSLADGGGQVARMLAGLDVPLTSFLPVQAPTTESGWSRYAAVVIVDATGTMLSQAQRESLGRYVRGGGGLFLIGAAPHSTPADRDDPLSRIAALQANPYQRRPMKVTVVLDASGSMSQLTEGSEGTPSVKFDVASEAVMTLKRHLTPRDSLAVVAFSDTPRRVFDSGDGTVDYVALRKALVDVKATGPTRVGQAIIEAVEAPRATGKTELILVISDLEAKISDVEALARRIDASGKSLAVVATVLPGTAKTKVTDLTKLTWRLKNQAPLERCEDFRGLAKIFATFLSKHRGSALRRQGGPFDVFPAGKPFGVDVAGLDGVSAYVLSASPGGQGVVMHVGQDKDPLMAYRRVGLGRSIGLATVLGEGENAAWQGSAKVAQLLRAAVAGCMRMTPDTQGGDYSAAVVEEGRRWLVRFTARDADGLPVNLPRLTLHIEALADTTGGRDVDLPQVAPGQYEVAADRPEGAYLLTVREATKGLLWQKAYGRGAPREYRAIGADRDNLRRLAELTGGKIVSASGVGQAARQWDSERYTDIWPALAGVALLLMLVDWVATRTWRRWA